MGISQDGTYMIANYLPAGNMQGSFPQNVQSKHAAPAPPPASPLPTAPPSGPPLGAVCANPDEAAAWSVFTKHSANGSVLHEQEFEFALRDIAAMYGETLDIQKVMQEAQEELDDYPDFPTFYEGLDYIESHIKEYRLQA